MTDWVEITMGGYLPAENVAAKLSNNVVTVGQSSSEWMLRNELLMRISEIGLLKRQLEDARIVIEALQNKCDVLEFGMDAYESEPESPIANALSVALKPWSITGR